MTMDFDLGLRRATSLLRLSDSLLLFIYCIFHVLGAVMPAPFSLHADEIPILKKIDSKLKIGWDFSVDPCSGTNGWVFKDENQSSNPSISVNTIVRNLTCGNCDVNSTCYVTGIELKTQNLTGVLPAEFADLKSLVNLDLTRNYINGTIPPEWGRSTSLVNISLGINRISGSIPVEIGNITTLNSLVLENNLLQDSVPSSLGLLTNLTRLIISANDLTGELPESLGNLKNLIDFRIDGSGISGKIASFMGNWTKLVKLYMQGTSLEGPFPPIFSDMVFLEEVHVSDLKGVGSFPPLQDTHLTILVLRNCSISGELPEFIGKMTKLQVLDLSFNNFKGEIPSGYQGLAVQIKNMYLTNNMLSGAIPNWILQSRQNIDLSFNSFDESSAPSHCDQQGTRLNVFSSYSSSSENSLINPCLKRNFPCSGKATNYELFINCGGDATNIGGCQYDEDKAVMGSSTFFLSYNQKWAFTSTGDFFMNPLANYIAYNTTLLHMRNPELYVNARLSPSSLRYYGLCLQKGSYTVNLHFAEIMFVDDQSYYSNGRRFFDVLIQGQNVLEDFNIVTAAKGIGKEVVMSFPKVEVNDNTLEIHFRWSGKGTSSVPAKGVYGPLISAISVTPNFKPEIENKRLSVGVIAGIIVASFVAILFLVFAWWFYMINRRPIDNVFQGVNLQTTQFSLAQIRSATGNFDLVNRIGQGGFGAVFKGTLPDGTIIAVKQLSSKSTQGNKEFINEIGMISALQHPNLVKILGCCIEENQLLLVYEFMENNSLFRALLGSEDKRLKLDWQARCNICLGVARGLAYLHEESRLKIIHRDIKATNILLDKNLNAKISDFGLARLHEEKQTHISTCIAGTRGYMAPEYAMRGRLTNKADVYSFGIVLLEGNVTLGEMGKLPDGTLIAVKQLSSKSRQGNREFITEIGMISALEHPNIVKLFGCCVHRDQLFLVYEYMENNSLGHVLLGPEEARLKLDWETRRKICLGIAKGLACLHDSRLKIIHRDIKAHNVLLDKDLKAKISDFGLATLYEDDDFTHMTIQVAGTRGYMAPEYVTKGHLSDKVDVYSFGIVLLETVSGKSNLISADNKSLHIRNWADEIKESETLLDIVDENLGSEYPVQEVEQMIKLALLCINESPTLRPAMIKVVSTLESSEYVDIPLAESGMSKSKELKLKAFLELPEDGTGTTTTQSRGYSMVASVGTTSTEPSMTLAMSAMTEDLQR